jgi:hypothetical protein
MTTAHIPQSRQRPQYTAWLVDDDAKKLVERLKGPLLEQSIDLRPFGEPHVCLNAATSAEAPPDVIIADLLFLNQPQLSRNVVGAYLPWRLSERATELKWKTRTTVLTNFLDRYFNDLKRIHQRNGYAPDLICSKNYVSREPGLRKYAIALRLLCESKSLGGIVEVMDGLPSHILEVSSLDKGGFGLASSVIGSVHSLFESRPISRRALVCMVIGAASLAFAVIGIVSMTAALDGHGILGQTSAFLNAVSIACFGFSVELLGGLFWLRFLTVPRMHMEE